MKATGRYPVVLVASIQFIGDLRRERCCNAGLVRYSMAYAPLKLGERRAMRLPKWRDIKVVREHKRYRIEGQNVRVEYCCSSP